MERERLSVAMPGDVTLRDNPILLKAMMEDMDRQNTLHKPTPYWAAYVERILQGIRRSGIESFRSDWQISKGYAEPFLMEPSELTLSLFKRRVFETVIILPVIRKIVEKYRYVRDWHIHQNQRVKSTFFRVLLEDIENGILLKKSLPDTLLGQPSDVVEVNGHTYAALYLELAHRIKVASSIIPFDKVFSVLEIGGGFGTNVHLLLHLFPNIRKVLIVDIPPILYVETEYLRAFYGDAIRDYVTTRKTRNLTFRDDDSLELFLIAPWQLDGFVCRSIDLFWNAASFQEMERDVVTYYVSNVLAMNPLWVYLYTLRDGIINNFVGQKEPVDVPFVRELFEPQYQFQEPNDAYNLYHNLCVHLLGKKDE